IECVPKLLESGDRTAYVNLSSTRGRGVVVVVNGRGEGDNAKVVRKDEHMAVEIFHPANTVRRTVKHYCFACCVPVHRLGNAGRNAYPPLSHPVVGVKANPRGPGNGS